MNPLPVIPKNETNHDVSDVLIDEFQATLTQTVFPKNIAASVKKNKTTNVHNLNESAGRVREASYLLDDALWGLETTENYLMGQQALYEDKMLKLKEKTCNEERILLSTNVNIFHPIDKETADLYGLIQGPDILPSAVEKALDFRYPNYDGKFISEIDDTKFRGDKYEKEAKKCAKKSLLQTKPCAVYKKPRKNLMEGKETKVKVDPEVLQFLDTLPETSIKVVVYLQNLSSFSLRFTLKSVPINKNIVVEFPQSNMPIAPHLKARATVKIYVAKNIHVDDKIVFTTQTYKLIEIPIKIETSHPKLVMRLVNDKHDLGGVKQVEGELTLSEEGINIDFEVGLVNDIYLLGLNLRNDGLNAKFCLLSASEWEDDNLKGTGCFLELENFMIYPRHFDIMQGESATITIIFKPTIEGVIREEIILLCSNNTFKKFYLKAESVYFHKDFVEVVVISESRHNSVIDKELFDIPPKGMDFTVYNKSPLKLKYYFSTNMGLVNCTDRLLRPEHLSIKGVVPFLEPNTKYSFKLELKTKEMVKNAAYVTDLKFFIEQIPLDSLQNKEEHIIIYSEVSDELQCTGVKQAVDVCFCEIELQHLTHSSIKKEFHMYLPASFGDINAFRFQSGVSIPFRGNLSASVMYIKSDQSRHLELLLPEDHLAYAYSLGQLGLGFPNYDYQMNYDDSYQSVHSPTPDDQTYSIEDIPQPPHVGFINKIENMGVIPSGVQFKKEIVIKNNSQTAQKWRVLEMIRDSCNNEVVVNCKTNFKPTSGVLGVACSGKLVYKVRDVKPHQWSSLLLLQTRVKKKWVTKSQCILVYESIVLNVKFKTSHPSLPILCPLEFAYKDVMATHEIALVNKSPLMGTFEFLTPQGKDADKVLLEFDPPSGVLGKNTQVKINVKVTPKEVGVLDEIQVPCFVGMDQKPLILRIVLIVDTIHVYFFLPKQDMFDRIRWPKIQELDLYECICNSEWFTGDEYFQPLSQLTSSQSLDKSEPTFRESELKMAYLRILKGTDEHKSVEFTESEDSLYVQPVLELDFKREFGDEIILQENVVEVLAVPLKIPTKFSFYIENLTPLTTTVSFSTTNFQPINDNFQNPLNQLLTSMKMKDTIKLWNSSMQKEFGILIAPMDDKLQLTPFAVTQVTFWIYANTYGCYMEEIAVHLEEVPSFCFSLLVEISGPPIEFPFALNAITPVPIIRFGHVAYENDPIKRKLKINNTSEVPVKLSLHFFEYHPEVQQPFNVVLAMTDEQPTLEDTKLIISNKYYGQETSQHLELSPRDLQIEPHSFIDVTLTLFPDKFKTKREQTDFNCNIIFYAFLNEEDRIKKNMFFRRTGKDLRTIKIEVKATIELPILKLDHIEGDTFIEAYTNDLISKKVSHIQVRLLFRNENHSPIFAMFHVELPFEIDFLKTSDGIEDTQQICVNPNKTLEVMLKIDVTQEYLFYISNLLYRNVTEIDLIDMTHNILTIPRYLNIHQRGISQQYIPLELRLHYPKIEVEPTALKFDSVLLNHTKKLLLVIKNLTAAEVPFEIYKTCMNNVIRCAPNHGVIKKSTGVNHSFMNVFVYFTPDTTQPISECIRIVTNIPEYFIDVAIKGVGMYNEKFYIHYKL